MIVHPPGHPGHVGLQQDGATFTIPQEPVRRRIHGIETFNVLRGGEYFFLPPCPRCDGSRTSACPERGDELMASFDYRRAESDG